MFEVFATAFIAGFVAIAVLGHVLVLTAILPRPRSQNSGGETASLEPISVGG